MSKLSNTTLGELVEFQRGYDLPKSDFKAGNIPVISSNGILGYHNEFKVKAPGITIGRSGTVGLPHYINENFFPHNTSLFIKDFKGNDPKYIFYLLQTLKLNDYKSGSGVPTMNRNHLHPIKIKAFLDNYTQKRIAHILSALDVKIELNNRINAQLEAMAKTIYDYWFVQFDFPDANGKPYKSSGGKMVWNDELKREVPKGWEVGTLGKYISIERGISYKGSEISESGTPMINLNSFHLDGRFKYEGTKYFTGSVNENKELLKGDLLIATTDVTRNAYIIGKSFLLPDLFNTKVIASCDIAKLIIDERLDKYYLDMLFNSDNYHKYIKGFASGTLVLHLDTKGIGWYNCILPPKTILDKFAAIKKGIDEKKTLTFKENQQLSSLRDWLLPMLMNGQVSVGE